MVKHRSDYLFCVVKQRGFRKICLILNDSSSTQLSFDITGWEKVENPAWAVYKEQIFVVWESYGQNCSLQYTSLDIKNINEDSCLLAGRKRITLTGNEERCYRPRLSSNGCDLLLCYEQFSNKHYAVVGRYMKEEVFSSPFTLGGDGGNNQEPFLTPLKEGFLLSYENSLPLYKDYVWISPEGDKVIIPAFGHGWRVETKSYLKLIEVEPDGLFSSVLADIDDPEGHRGYIPLDNKQSSGCPRVLSLGKGNLLALYCSMENYLWNVRYALYQKGHWQESVTTEISQSRRVTPDHVPEVFKNFDLMNESLEGELFTLKKPCLPFIVKIPKKTKRSIKYQDKNLKLLWGDLHMHSNLSKCSLHSKFHCVELEEKYRQSHDVGRLDFAMCTDHDNMTDSEWERTKSEADFHNRPGHFTAFQGFEWTATHGPGPKQGHYNVLYRNTGRLYRVSEEGGNHITKLWKDMKKGEVLTIPHHPADETHSLDWHFFDPDYEPLVEIFQVRGSYEYPGNSMDPSFYRPEKMVPGATILETLEKGYQFGFTSGGEHEGVGTTAVFALENTREALFDALRHRQVYGTTGDHIFMDFRVNGTLMGGEISSITGNPELKIHIEGTAPIKELRVMRDGKKIFSQSYKESRVELTWVDKGYSGIQDTRDVHYYYLAVEQENGEIGWASPIFIIL